MLPYILLCANLSTVVLSVVPQVRFPRPKPNNRIIGGFGIDIEVSPYQLSFEHYSKNACGASLISSSTAVTAAHCTAGILVSNMRVRGGSTFRGKNGQVVTVSKVRQHPNFNNITLNYDIAVLLLSSSFTLGPAIQTIEPIAYNQVVAAGTMCIATGWGVVVVGGTYYDTLQAVLLPIISDADCKRVYNHSITDSMFCAGFMVGGRDTCSGDSGGPLRCGDVLVGVISFGNGCALPNNPGIYTNVAKFSRFIKNAFK